MEVLSILFLDATIKWANAHVGKAVAEGDMARLKAEIYIFESAIERERKRIDTTL